MGLKQSIVIRSEYTNNVRSAPGKGSRGATPGQYVMRYMAREDATEVLTPVKIDGYDSEKFTRYMARKNATEKLKLKDDDLLQDPDAWGSPLVVKHRFRKIDKLSGRSFGTKGISLSQDELEESSELIQEAFEDGHSVQKIILSFTEEYLRETGVLNPNFKHKGRGSYKGQVDQLKLRQAIISGVDNMTKAGRFISPEWVGTIQFDTSHVHSHIALVDKEFSKARMKEDGADRGKINEREKMMLRKGINFSLEDMKDLKSFHKQASLERQNVVAFVKDYAYDTLYNNTSIQLLMASLPKNKNQWRFKSNSKAMKHPNKLAKNIIEDVFEKEPDKSGYIPAMKSIENYANESAVKNRLNSEEKQKLIDNGYNMLLERSVNGLYSTLKEVGDYNRNTRTVMTDIQSSSDEQLIQAINKFDGEFNPASFELRVRGYNTRQEHHKNKSREFYNLSEEFDKAYDEGFVDDTAHVMRVFYEEEQRYHMGLTDKYRKFLSFSNDRDRANIKYMEPVYETLVNTYNSLNEKGFTDREKEDYLNDLKDYTFECFERGVATLKEWESIVDYDRENNQINTRFVLPIRPKSRSENINQAHFDRVKALDVHHLGFDYYNVVDARIDSVNTLRFAEGFENRKMKIEPAKNYLDNTNQRLKALDDALDDMVEMEKAVERALDEGTIEAVTVEELTDEDERQLRTISADYSIDVTDRVRRSVELINIEEQIEVLE